jgi:hypothetical protein
MTAPLVRRRGFRALGPRVRSGTSGPLARAATVPYYTVMGGNALGSRGFSTGAKLVVLRSGATKKLAGWRRQARCFAQHDGGWRRRVGLRATPAPHRYRSKSSRPARISRRAGRPPPRSVAAAGRARLLSPEILAARADSEQPGLWSTVFPRPPRPRRGRTPRRAAGEARWGADGGPLRTPVHRIPSVSLHLLPFRRRDTILRVQLSPVCPGGARALSKSASR